MAVKCETCIEKCPQAEMAHKVALGRMYATKEFISLLKKVESGELVEVVRCKDCCFTQESPFTLRVWCDKHHKTMKETDFCSWGERKEDDGMR